MNFKSRETIIALVLLLAFLLSSFFVKLTAIPIRIWDEARLANNALHMYLHGNWLVTFYDGSPDMWNTKPPLLIWLQVISMKIFGVNEFAIRFPSATASVCTGFLIFFFCSRQFKNVWLGFLAASIFASTFAFVYLHAGRSGDYDALLVFFTTFYCFCFYLFITEGAKKWMYLFWIFLTLSVMTKGVAGLLLLPGLFIFLLSQKKFRKVFTTPASYSGLLLFFIIVGGYYLLREKYNPGYLHAVYENELGGRYLNTLEEHSHPFWHYYNYIRKWRYHYWAFLIIPAFAVGAFLRFEGIKKITLFLFLMVIPFWLIISFGQTKLEWYDLPIYPFLAIQIGILLYYSWYFFKEKIIYKFSSTTKSVLAVVAFILVFFKPFKEVKTHIHHFTERQFDVEPHKPGYFLQDAIKQNRNLNNYIFYYEDYNAQINLNYNAQIKFYLEKLRSEGINVQLHENIDSINKGNSVVVCQEKLKQLILKNFITETKEEYSGCTVFLIKSRL